LNSATSWLSSTCLYQTNYFKSSSTKSKSFNSNEKTKGTFRKYCFKNWINRLGGIVQNYINSLAHCVHEILQIFSFEFQFTSFLNACRDVVLFVTSNTGIVLLGTKNIWQVWYFAKKAYAATSSFSKTYL